MLQVLPDEAMSSHSRRAGQDAQLLSGSNPGQKEIVECPGCYYLCYLLRITRDIDLSNAVALACGGDDIHVEPSLS